jgi:hypothetical protein
MALRPGWSLQLVDDALDAGGEVGRRLRQVFLMDDPWRSSGRP